MRWVRGLRRVIRERWTACLSLLALLLFILNTVLFYPGYMSPDSLSQLAQTLGTQPVADWHPPVMVFVWKSLYFFTHHTSSMLIFQAALLWASLLLFSLVIFKTVHSYRLSLTPLIVGLLPVVLNISGVIWKDVQMAHALLFAVALVLYVSRVKVHRYIRWGALAGAAALLLYAALLRYNVILAILPIGYLFVSQFDQSTFKKIRYVVTAGLVGLLGVGYAVVHVVLRPQASHPASAIMLDDVINTMPSDELQLTTMPQPLKTALLYTQNKCHDSKVVMNAYFACATQVERDIISMEHPDVVANLWVRALANNPIGYMSYRIETFSIFLTAPDKHMYIWQNGTEPNQLGQSVNSERAQNMLKTYTLDFGYRNFPVLYQAWFWLLVAIIIFKLSQKSKLYRKYIRVLLLSAVLYILSYIPVVVATDYRYIYWSVLAILIAAILVVAERWPLRLAKN